MSAFGLTLPTPLNVHKPSASAAEGALKRQDPESDSSPVTSDYESVSDANGLAAIARATAALDNLRPSGAHAYAVAAASADSSSANDDHEAVLQLQLHQEHSNQNAKDYARDSSAATPAIGQTDGTDDDRSPNLAPQDAVADGHGHGHGEQAKADRAGGSDDGDGDTETSANGANLPSSSSAPQRQHSSHKFQYDVDKLYLSSADDEAAWVAQAEAIALASNCLTELTQKFDFKSFPRDGTVMALVCSARFTTAWKILEETISGPVWAMMRVYGLQGHYKSHMLPCDVYGFARWAAGRMRTAGTAEQPRDERMAMVREMLETQSIFYPSPRCYQDGVAWIRMRLHALVLLGDYEVAAAIYNPLPSWAPRPPSGAAPASQPAVLQPAAPPRQYVSAYPPVPSPNNAAPTPPALTDVAAAAVRRSEQRFYPPRPKPIEEPPLKRKRGRPPQQY